MKNEFKRVGVDVDEVLASMLVSFVDFHNSQYGTNIRVEDFTKFSVGEVCGFSKEIEMERMYEFYFSDYFKKILPVEGSESGIKELKKDYDLFVITARSDSISKETISWLENYFPNSFKDVLFTNHYEKDSKSKGDVCLDLNIDILIDDNLDNVYDCLDKGKEVLLFDNIWNRDNFQNENIKRVYSWVDIIDFFK